MHRFLFISLALVCLLAGCSAPQTSDPATDESDSLDAYFEEEPADNEMGSAEFGLQDPMDTVYTYDGESLEIPFSITGASFGKTTEIGVLLFVDGVAQPYSAVYEDGTEPVSYTHLSKGISGKHLTGTVIYGYLWDEKREHWLVDEEAAEVVRRIFSLTMEGYGPYQISKLLSEAKVEIPAVHLAHFDEGVNRTKPVKDPYGWGSSTIVSIPKKREYLTPHHQFQDPQALQGQEKPLCP